MPHRHRRPRRLNILRRLWPTPCPWPPSSGRLSASWTLEWLWAGRLPSDWAVLRCRPLPWRVCCPAWLGGLPPCPGGHPLVLYETRQSCRNHRFEIGSVCSSFGRLSPSEGFCQLSGMFGNRGILLVTRLHKLLHVGSSLQRHLVGSTVGFGEGAYSLLFQGFGFFFELFPDVRLNLGS